MNPVEALAKLDLSQKAQYHADGHGHIQYVDMTPNFDFGSDPTSLLNEIDSQHLWQDFDRMLTSKPENWQLDLINYLPQEQDYAIEYIVKLVNNIESAETKTYLMQQIRGWSWTPKALKLAPKIRSDFNALHKAILLSDNDEFTIECTQQMYRDILTELDKLVN